MTERRDFYVYEHLDSHGSVFYVGKGCGNRAWSKDRQVAWLHYVEHHLNGSYTIRLVHEGLSERDAENLEDTVASRYRNQLINVQNQHTDFDFSLWKAHESLSSRSRYRAHAAHQLEKHDALAAVKEYIIALQETYEADSLQFESSLYSRIRREIDSGDLQTLNRITICLKRLGNVALANELALKHLVRYPMAKRAKQWISIAKRTGLAT